MDEYTNLTVPKMGMIRVLATDAKHIYVSTNECGFITVNGVNYYLSAHIYFWDGSWHWGASRDTQYREPHMRRTDRPGNGDYNPSYSAREKVRAEVMAVVLGWLGENPHALKVAEVDDLRKQLVKKLKEKDELVAKVAENLAQVSELRGRIADLEENFKLEPVVKAS